MHLVMHIFYYYKFLYSKMIEDCKKEGRLVPSDLVVKLLQQAMQGSQNKKFVIDGFPRNEENRAAAESIVGLQFSVLFVLAIKFFDSLITLLNVKIICK